MFGSGPPATPGVPASGAWVASAASVMRAKSIVSGTKPLIGSAATQNGARFFNPSEVSPLNPGLFVETGASPNRSSDSSSPSL